MLTKGKNEVSLESLGEYLTRVFRERGIDNITEFARSIAHSRSQISRMLDGKQGGSIDTFVDVAKALNIRPGELVDIYADVPSDPDHDPETLRLARKLRVLPPDYRKNIESLIDGFLAATQNYNSITDLSNKL